LRDRFAIPAQHDEQLRVPVMGGSVARIQPSRALEFALGFVPLPVVILQNLCHAAVRFTQAVIKFEGLLRRAPCHAEGCVRHFESPDAEKGIAIRYGSMRQGKIRIDDERPLQLRHAGKHISAAPPAPEIASFKVRNVSFGAYRRGLRRGDRVGDGGNEAITSPRNGFNETRGSPAIAQGGTELAHALVDCRVKVNKRACGPNASFQFFAGHQVPVIFKQHLEHQTRLEGQPDLYTTLSELVPGGPEFERPKAKDTRAIRDKRCHSAAKHTMCFVWLEVSKFNSCKISTGRKEA
jgi:hypothetical protein